MNLVKLENKNLEETDLIYKTVSIIFSNSNVKRIDKLPIEVIFEIYFWLQFEVVKIEEKINSIFLRGEEPIKKEKSIFDDYDRENGYLDDEEETLNQAEERIEIVNRLIKYGIENFRNSLVETLEMDIFIFLDFLDFSINNKQ